MIPHVLTRKDLKRRRRAQLMPSYTRALAHVRMREPFDAVGVSDDPAARREYHRKWCIARRKKRNAKLPKRVRHHTESRKRRKAERAIERAARKAAG